MRDDYCVYYHKDKYGVIRYVGSGTLKRPSRRSNRNKAWHKLFDNDPFTIEIVKENLTKSESLTLEEQLILENKDTVVNARKPVRVVELDYHTIDRIVEISGDSPSGLVWKVPSGRWGKFPPGTVAGSLSGKNEKKYWLVNYKEFSFSAHRAIYLLTHGTIDANLVINHIDGNSTNNKIENLEQVSQSHNVYKIDKQYGSYGRNITVRYHKGSPMSVVAKFCFKPNQETQKILVLRHVVL